MSLCGTPPIFGKLIPCQHICIAVAVYIFHDMISYLNNSCDNHICRTRPMKEACCFMPYSINGLCIVFYLNFVLKMLCNSSMINIHQTLMDLITLLFLCRIKGCLKNNNSTSFPPWCSHYQVKTLQIKHGCYCIIKL